MFSYLATETPVCAQTPLLTSSVNLYNLLNFFSLQRLPPQNGHNRKKSLPQTVAVRTKLMNI